mgnify:CR=1 FL=1
MVPAHVLSVDIIMKGAVSLEKFQELTSPSLISLNALKGAFDRKPCDYTYRPLTDSKGWLLRCVLMISVGKERGKHLLQLYRDVVDLIQFQLPECGIRAETSILNFSS